MKLLLGSLSSSRLGCQTSGLRAAPVRMACRLCAHKHCHSVRLPSSSKGYGVIRYTGEINSSAPEKSRTQPAHLPVHKTHLLTLQCRLASSCLTLLCRSVEGRWSKKKTTTKKQTRHGHFRFVFHFAFFLIFLNMSKFFFNGFSILMPKKIHAWSYWCFSRFLFSFEIRILKDLFCCVKLSHPPPFLNHVVCTALQGVKRTVPLYSHMAVWIVQDFTRVSSSRWSWWADASLKFQLNKQII